jgi:hypothetical protein
LETEGAHFTDATFQNALNCIAPLHSKGPQKNFKMVAQKWTNVSTMLSYHHILLTTTLRQLKEHWRMIDTYQNSSGASWDANHGGFFRTSTAEQEQFQAYCAGIKKKVSIGCWS